jgi:ParB-like chromosome segregation protein Spo0J
MNIKQINIDDIIPYHNNPRKNQAIDKVASSIKEYGFQQPIVVDKHMVVIVGHTRLLGAKKLGLKEVPIVIADLSDAKAKAYRIADNRVNEESDWDFKLLQGELNILLDLETDLNLTGFSSDELDSMFSKEEIEITDPIDAIDEQDYLTNDVKMVQLFYEPVTEKRFREIIDLIKDNNNIDNMSDAVMYCVLNEEKRQKG